VAAGGSTRHSLAVDGLTKVYGDLRALDGASFGVESGRIVGFLGPNGAGKTTAMRCLLGLVEPNAGSMTWDGTPLTGSIRLSFGYMPEERGLYPKMRIGEQLAYFGRLSGMDAAAARSETGLWLERLGLADRVDSRLEQLSHGNQQRVQLVAALIHRPGLAVLDEPFSGLDPLGVEAMSMVLRDLADTGTAVLFSSHQLDLVEDLCDDVVVIERGRVVLDGELERLKSNASSRLLTVTVDDLPWVDPDFGLLTEALVDRGVDLDRVVRSAGEAGRITRFVFEAPRLSDLFREAVSR